MKQVHTSQPLTTLKGQYYFLCMLFRIKMSQDVFQMRMDNIAYRLLSILTIHYNICVFGCTSEEHDTHLIQLMQVATKNGLVFNSNKCKIRLSEISIYGAVFTSKCMKPNPSKVQALRDLPTPNNQMKLQSFLGLINYLPPFIPRLSNKTNFLREQLAKWDWNSCNGTAFQCLKLWICLTLLKTILTYYDRTKPVIIQTDASEYKLGAACIQDGCPITSASNILTNVET